MPLLLGLLQLSVGGQDSAAVLREGPGSLRGQGSEKLILVANAPGPASRAMGLG